MSSAAGDPTFSDVTGRMAVFGRLFGEQAGIPEVAALRTPEELVEVLKACVRRSAAPADDAPVFEAAAYAGEWMRARTMSTWVAEGPFEPHLQLVDRSRAIVYLLPLVSMIRTASTAGYDGLALLLATVLADVSKGARRANLGELRVVPEADRGAVAAWARANRDIHGATRAALWRRCSVCSHVEERVLTLHRPGDDWEGEAATAASVLSANPFACPCGGPPGVVTRFLMVRAQEGAKRLGDIYVTANFTRVGCWTLDGDDVEPFDALALTNDEMLSG